MTIELRKLIPPSIAALALACCGSANAGGPTSSSYAPFTPFFSPTEINPGSPATRAGLIPNLHFICDPTGKVDCTANFNSTISKFTSTQAIEVDGTPGDFYYFKAPGPTIPSNVTLNLKMEANKVPNNGVYGLNSANVGGLGPGPGGILLDTGAQITLGNNSTIENGICINANLPVPTSAAQAITYISNYAGTCVNASNDYDTVSNFMEIGFATGIAALGTDGRVTIKDDYCDNTTCIDIENGRDYSSIFHVYANDMYTSRLTFASGGYPLALVNRAGSVIFYANASDDLTVNNVEDYGHNTCATIYGSYISHWDNIECEESITASGTVTTYGFNIFPGTAPKQTNLNSNVDMGHLDLSGKTYEINIASNPPSVTPYTAGGVTVRGATLGSGGGGTQFFVNIGANTYASFSQMKFLGGPKVFNIGANSAVTVTDSLFASTNTQFTVDPTSVQYLTDIGNQYAPNGNGQITNDPYEGMIAGQGLSYTQVTTGTNTVVSAFPSTWVSSFNLGTSTNPINQLWANNKVFSQTIAVSAPPSPTVVNGTPTSPTVIGNAFTPLTSNTATSNNFQLPNFNLGGNNYTALEGVFNTSTFPLYEQESSSGSILGITNAGTLTLGPNTGQIIMEDASGNYYPITGIDGLGITSTYSNNGTNSSTTIQPLNINNFNVTLGTAANPFYAMYLANKLYAQTTAFSTNTTALINASGTSCSTAKQLGVSSNFVNATTNNNAVALPNFSTLAGYVNFYSVANVGTYSAMLCPPSTDSIFPGTAGSPIILPSGATEIFLETNTGTFYPMSNTANYLQLPTPYTVNTLPACNISQQGSALAVSDATQSSFSSTLTGGGSLYTLVICNGTNWTTALSSAQGLPSWSNVNNQTAGYTLKTSDIGSMLTENTVSVSYIRLPTPSSIGANPGSVIGVTELGNGPMIIQPQAGVTLNGSSASMGLNTAYTSGTLTSLTGTSWLFTGSVVNE